MEKKVNVLVIDDNVSITDSIKKYFGSHGGINVVDTCNNGMEALDYILHYPDKYDLIIMDIILPTIDGLEILDKMYEKGISKKNLLAIEEVLQSFANDIY